MINFELKSRRILLVLFCFLIGLIGLNVPKRIYAASPDSAVTIDVTKTEHEITLLWTNKDPFNELSYEVQRDGKVITTLDYGIYPIIHDRNLDSNTTYNYKIYEINGDEKNLIYTNDIATDKDETPPTITEPSTSVNPNSLIFDGNGTLYKNGVAQHVNTEDSINEDGTYTLVVKDDVGDEISKSFIIDHTPPAHAELARVETQGDYAYLTLRRPIDSDFSKMEIYSGGIKTMPNLLKVIPKNQFSQDGTYKYLQKIYNLTKGPETLNIVTYDNYGNQDSSMVPDWQTVGAYLNLPGAFFEIKQSNPIYFTSPKVKSIQQIEGGFTIAIEFPVGTNWAYFNSNLGKTEIPFHEVTTKSTVQVLKFPLKNIETLKTTPIGEKATLKYEIDTNGYVNTPVKSQYKSKPLVGTFNYDENNYRFISPKFLEITNKKGAILYKDKSMKFVAKKGSVSTRFIVVREDVKYAKVSDGSNIYCVKKSDVRITKGLNQKKNTIVSTTLKSAKNSSSRTISTISKNKQVIVLQQFTGWYYVNVDGKLGYVLSKYLK